MDGIPTVPQPPEKLRGKLRGAERGSMRGRPPDSISQLPTKDTVLRRLWCLARNSKGAVAVNACKAILDSLEETSSVAFHGFFEPEPPANKAPESEPILRVRA